MPHNPTELRVKTVKYFKSIERVQDEVEKNQAQLKANAILQKQVVSTG
jgi:glucosamine-6-phosphate deaminase